MKKKLKKIILTFLSFLLLFSTYSVYLTPKVLAQESESTWYNQSFQEWHTKVYGDGSPPSEIFGERYTAAQVEWIIYGIFSFILNHISDTNTTAACIGGDTTACTDAISQAIQQLQQLIQSPQSSSSQTYSPNNNTPSLVSLVFSQREFSGIGYVREKISKFALIPTANAQVTGFGYGALEPIRELWGSVRNVAYSFSVFAILVFAFMIMFRVKISPQVVISVQSALPKVIIALVLVTFSYAIAGFVIDLMYVVIGLISTLLSPVVGNPSKNFITMTQGLPILGTGILGLMAMYSVLFFWSLLFVLFASGNPVVNLVLSPILSLLFFILIIIAAIMLIFILIKTIWLLLKTLAQTYLIVIFGPLQIMLGTLVSSSGFGPWLRSLVANLSVYPTVGTLFLLSLLFLFYSLQLGLGNLLGNGPVNILSNLIFGTDVPLPNGQWSPPLTLGESYMPLMFLAISFVLLTLIPKAADMIQSIISGKPFAYGTGIGEAFGPVRWAGGVAYNQSGARDIWEISQILRKSRVMDRLLREGSRSRRLVERFIGGDSDEASGSISSALKNYRERAGRPREI